MAASIKPKGLLKLPAELRVEIYNLINIPFKSALSDYRGLYLSCQGIKQEMDHEIFKKLKPFVESLQAKWTADPKTNGIVIELLPRFSRIHLKVTFPTISGPVRTTNKWKDELRVLSDIHLDTLEVALVANDRPKIFWTTRYTFEEECGFISNGVMLAMHESCTFYPRKIPAAAWTFHPRRVVQAAEYADLYFNVTRDWVGTVKQGFEEGDGKMMVYRRV